MAGSVISLGVGFTAVLISLFIGILLGAWAGYRRTGRCSHQLVHPSCVDVANAAHGPRHHHGIWQGTLAVFLAIGLAMWVDVARLCGEQFFALREMEFIQAAQALDFLTSA